MTTKIIVQYVSTPQQLFVARMSFFVDLPLIEVKKALAIKFCHYYLTQKEAFNPVGLALGCAVLKMRC